MNNILTGDNVFGGTLYFQNATATDLNLAGTTTVVGNINTTGNIDTHGSSIAAGAITCTSLNTISDVIIGYLAGISSNVQDQINAINAEEDVDAAKIADMNAYNIGTSTSSFNNNVSIGNNLTLDGSLIVNGGANTLSGSELSYLDGVTSNIQTQFTDVYGATNTFTGAKTFTSVSTNAATATSTNITGQISSVDSSVKNQLILGPTSNNCWYYSTGTSSEYLYLGNYNGTNDNIQYSFLSGVGLKIAPAGDTSTFTEALKVIGQTTFINSASGQVSSPAVFRTSSGITSAGNDPLSLIISNNNYTDSQANGGMTGGTIYPQFGFGHARLWVHATDSLTTNKYAYFGCHVSGDPDPDFFITYANDFKVKIGVDSNTWTETLKVVGTTNITSDLAIGGNLSVTGTVNLASGSNIILASPSATISPTELSYLDGVTSAIQTQIDGKASLSGNNTFSGTTNTFNNSVTFGAANSFTGSNTFAAGAQIFQNGGTNTAVTGIITTDSSVRRQMFIGPSSGNRWGIHTGTTSNNMYVGFDNSTNTVVQYTYKNGTGLKISPASADTATFTEALRVVGDISQTAMNSPGGIANLFATFGKDNQTITGNGSYFQVYSASAFIRGLGSGVFLLASGLSYIYNLPYSCIDTSNYTSQSITSGSVASGTGVNSTGGTGSYNTYSLATALAFENVLLCPGWGIQAWSGSGGSAYTGSKYLDFVNSTQNQIIVTPTTKTVGSYKIWYRVDGTTDTEIKFT